MDAPTEDAVANFVGEDIPDDEEGEDESSVEYSYQYSDEDPNEDVEEANGDDDDASSLSSNSNHSIDVDDKEQSDEVVANEQDSSQPQTNLSRVGTAEREPIESQRPVLAVAVPKQETDNDDWEMIVEKEEKGPTHGQDDDRKPASRRSGGDDAQSMGSWQDVSMGTAARSHHATANRMVTDEANRQKPKSSDDDQSWSMISDNTSIKTMTTMSTVNTLSGHAAPKFDLSGFDIEIQRGRKDIKRDDLTVSLSSTVFAHGTRVCVHCTFMNKHNAGFCEVCGLPLTANPSMDIDYEIAARLAQEDQARMASEDAMAAQQLQRAIALQRESFSHKGPAGPSLEEAHKLIDRLLQIKLPQPLAAMNDHEKARMPLVLLAQQFIEFRNACLLSARSGHVSTRYLYFKGGGPIPYSERLEEVKACLTASKAGTGAGILVYDNPYTFARKPGNMIAICAIVAGQQDKEYAADVDSIYTYKEYKLCMRRPEQCFPVVCFRSDMVSRVVDESEMNKMIWNVQVEVQKALDDVFHNGCRTVLEAMLPSQVNSGRVLSKPSEQDDMFSWERSDNGSTNLSNRTAESPLSSNPDTVVSTASRPRHALPFPIRLLDGDGPYLEARGSELVKLYFNRSYLSLTSWPWKPVADSNGLLGGVAVTDDLCTRVKNGKRVSNNVEGFIYVFAPWGTKLSMKISRASGMTMKVNSDFCKIVHANDEESVAEITVSDADAYIPVAAYFCRTAMPTQLETKCFPVTAKTRVQRWDDMCALSVELSCTPHHRDNIRGIKVLVSMVQAIGRPGGVAEGSIITNGVYHPASKQLSFFVDKVPDEKSPPLVVAGFSLRSADFDISKLLFTTTVCGQVFEHLASMMSLSITDMDSGKPLPVARKIRLCHQDLQIAAGASSLASISET